MTDRGDRRFGREVTEGRRQTRSFFYTREDLVRAHRIIFDSPTRSSDVVRVRLTSCFIKWSRSFPFVRVLFTA